MDKETFDFSEALRRMKEGKKVRSKNWDKRRMSARTLKYICINGSKSLAGVFADNSVDSYLLFTSEDVLATDWEEVEQ